MKTREFDISDRMLEYGLKIIKITQRVKGDFVYKHITKQLFRSGTSAGANYEEAKAAESKADFIHKLYISLKELREALYWLKLFKYSLNMIELDTIINETEELCRIFNKSIKTTKGK